MLRRIGHFAGLFFILVILFSTRSFLGTHPLLSGLSFFLFTWLYLVTTVISQERLFLYPVMFFGTLSYYLFLYILGVPPNSFPAFSPMLIFGLLAAARILENKQKQYFTIPLYRGMLFTVVIFTFWILQKTHHYFTVTPAIPFFTFLGYAAFYYVRTILSAKPGLLYPSLTYFAASTLALFYWIPFIGPVYYGLFLLVLVGFGIYWGTRLHKSKGSDYGLPFYLVGFIVLLISFVYSGKSLSVVLISFFFSSLIYWGGLYLLRKITTSRELAGRSEKFLESAFLCILNVSGLVAVVLFAYHAFPIMLTGIVVSFFFTILFLRMAFERKITFLKLRNHYIYLSGIFFILFYFLLLFFIRPMDDFQLSLFFSFGLLAIILVFARLMEKRKEVILFRSTLDLNYIVVAAVFILSFFGNSYSTMVAAILSVLFLIAYIVFMALRKQTDLMFTLIIIAGYGYYNLLVSLGINQQYLGIVFLPVGLILMAATHLFHKKASPLKGTFYFGWLLFALISIYLAFPFPVMNILCFSVWAVSSLILGQAIVGKDKRRLVT